MQDNGLPSRTAILTAAARALGSREPDESVRNPDWLADRLIGPPELALIAEHAIGRALDRDFEEAIADPDVFGFVWRCSCGRDASTNGCCARSPPA